MPFDAPPSPERHILRDIALAVLVFEFWGGFLLMKVVDWVAEVR